MTTKSSRFSLDQPLVSKKTGMNGERVWLEKHFLQFRGPHLRGSHPWEMDSGCGPAGDSPQLARGGNSLPGWLRTFGIKCRAPVALWQSSGLNIQSR